MKLMKSMRGWLERNEKKFLVALVIFLLVIFTVASDVVQWLKPDDARRQRTDDVVGSFALLPLDKIEVTRGEFEHALDQCRLIAMLQGGSGDGVRVSEVWVYLLLQHAAKAQGITVTDAEVRDQLKRDIPDFIYNDVQRYKDWIRGFGRTPRQFEETFRSRMIQSRVRTLYAESFLVAPPTTRENMVKKYADDQRIEFARVHYAALDAAAFLADAEKELAAGPDADAKLKEFYEKDPAVQAERTQFQNPRRYRVEFLYTLHNTIGTEEEYRRVEKLFEKTYRDLDVGKLEKPVKDLREYFGHYRDRLLEQEGTTWAKVQEQIAAEKKAKEAKDKEEKDKEGQDGNDPPKQTPDKPAEPDAATKEAWFERGFEICKEQVMREIKLRGMYQWFRDEAAKDPKKSFRELFEKLKAADDPENPICSDEMGKGIIVFLDIEKPLSGEEIEDLEDRGVRFTHNVRFRVNEIGDTDLPKVFRKADPMGAEAHGRMMIRLLEVKPQVRKTYAELEPREREDLRTEFYLPARAREKAVAKLEEFRKLCIDGNVEPAAFREEAEKLGCRVFENEWITASYDFLADPEKPIYWPDAYRHMQDRHFLRLRLASVFSRDRIKQELKPGSYLDVETNARSEAEDPGAAYLVVLLERRKPGADTMPPTEFTRSLSNARTQRLTEDQQRWGIQTIKQMDRLFADFEFEFKLDMKDRINDERKRREEAERRRAPAGQ